MLSNLIILAAAATAVPSSTSPRLSAEIQVCEADLHAALQGDHTFVQRFAAYAKLTDDETAPLEQTCSIYDLGAAAMLEIVQPASPEPLPTGDSTPI